ncbi:MAG: trypsin-like serine protease [Desulfobacteraceae bacterium]|nr:trypsin-like serine protease [Desulfobacteraceae bacterium]
MKRCTFCEQIVAQSITTCPACGSHIVAGIKFINDYRILNIIHEDRSSLVCKAIKKDGAKPVTIRLFTEQSGINDTIAKRLETELKELAKLPTELFVQHFAVKKTNNGLWYRVSEWVDADNWGAVFVSGILKDQRRMVTLFHNIAAALEKLHDHDHFMPYLILEDILIPKNQTRNLGVKINYKLSRFLNARATHHGPMLKKLLSVHPDIINEQAIDFRTDIWSLGKIFVELLTGDHNLMDVSSKMNQLKGLDPELGILIKVMLSDEPDLRPQTMAQLTSALSRILNRMPHRSIFPSTYKQKPKLLKELNWFRRIVVLLLVLIVTIIAANNFSWLHRDSNQNRNEIVFSDFIESYANSIGFIMVEYWLMDSTQLIYKNRVEGTAFLVDDQGYILTNRHVACPWLEDPTLFQIYNQYKLVDKKLDFNHRIFLWFEGKKAFKRLPGLQNSHELADSYYLSSAFQSDGKNNLRIVGVPRASSKTGEIINSPFKHDFAVLKIDTIPENLIPLPLEADLDATDIPRLSPIIILGFPLGNRTQDDYISASITRGRVRRSTKEIIQVNSSIYKGNSGGPAVNARGHVIGIASGVVTDQPTRYVPANTPLSDFGLVLPISRPAQFIEDLKAGQPKWDGKLDFTLDIKLKKIIDLSLEHKYAQAAALTDVMLKTSKDPILFFTSAILHFCSNNLDKSRRLFTQLISIDTKNTTARLMLHIIDWSLNQDQSRALTKDLFTMDWRHSDEFSGYLAMVLNKELTMDPGFIDFENNTEKAWRLFIQGLIMEKGRKTDMAIKYYKQTILTAGGNDYLYLLAFAKLDELLSLVENKKTHQAQITAFLQKANENREKAKERYTTASALIDQFESPETSHEEKIKTYQALLKLIPDNRTIIGRVAFFHAMNSEWEKALTFINHFFSKPSRETGLSLSLGLLKGGILNITAPPELAKAHLMDFQSRTQAPWYKIISKHLARKKTNNNLGKLAGHNPEKLITLHTALGLWAEGVKDKKIAAHHYREALSTYLDGWNEYDLALSRIIRLRKPMDE